MPGTQPWVKLSIVKALKDNVAEMIRSLPADSTLEDIQYHLYVIEKVQRGIRAAEQHGEITQEQAEQRLARWTTE